MSENKNKDRVAPATYIAIAGLVVLGLSRYFGLLIFQENGEPKWAIVGALLFTAVLGALLVMSIKAKKQSENPQNWRIVEIACIVIYAIVAVFFCKPITQFFSVITSKSELQKMANDDLGKLKTLYSQYDNWRNEKLDNAGKNLQRFIDLPDYDKFTYRATRKYTIDYCQDIEMWKSTSETATQVSPSEKQALNDCATDIANWTFSKLPKIVEYLGNNLGSQSNSAYQKLQDKVQYNIDEHHIIPSIDGNYNFSDYEQFDAPMPGISDFAAKMAVMKPSVGSYLLYAILHLLIILNYLVAARTTVMGIEDMSDKIGGRPLI